MTDRCPTCERNFNYLEDYPLIYVAKFKRVEVPAKVIMPDHTWEVFVGPKLPAGNKKVPQEAAEFFKNNKNESEFTLGENTWVLESRTTEPYPKPMNIKFAPENSIGIRVLKWFNKTFGRKYDNPAPPMEGEIGEDWEIGTYSRVRKDATKLILAKLAPYFDTLESLVGKEVPVSQVLPPFGKTRHGYCEIPDTAYSLTLTELDNPQELKMLQDNKLSIPVLETQQPTKKLAFVLTTCDGGTMSFVDFVASVAGLAYEGRIKK
jgi:hypothetical protein